MSDTTTAKDAMSDGKFLLDDAEFIAHAPADITALLQENERLRELVEWATHPPPHMMTVSTSALGRVEQFHAKGCHGCAFTDTLRAALSSPPSRR